jgi:Xaa-Pro aminopeptidase
VRYLAGPAPQGTVLLLGKREDLLVCTGPPEERPADGRPDEALRIHELTGPGGDPAVAAADLAAAQGAESMAVEEHHLTVARHRALRSVAPTLRLTDIGGAVEQLRVVKDEEEISCLRIAAEIADQALGELLESILVGRTERHLALELERRLVDHGADGPAFATSVATGPHSGRRGTGRPIAGSRKEISFLSASVPLPRLPLRDRPYVRHRDLSRRLADRAVRPRLRRPEGCAGVPDPRCRLPGCGPRGTPGAGLRGVFGGPRSLTGHGVGLEIDEEPQLAPAAMGKLDACVPVTVEPGVHLPGRGGVRIDDTLVVRPEADGGPELLTITTKELLAL